VRGYYLRRDKLLILTRVLYILFLIGTIISLVIVYKDIKNNIAIKFVIGYVILTFFLLLYIPIVTILNLRKSKLIDIKTRMIKFISLFIIFTALNYGIDFILRHSNINIFREIPTALGLAFGLSFIDVILFKKK
jgi:hypothetical protein